MLSDGEKLLLLRAQLYTAMQWFEGDALRDFWQLIDEINDCRPLHPPPAATVSDAGRE